MALVLDDFQLERICDRSTDFCGLNCRQCEAFLANLRYHGYIADDDDDEDPDSWDDDEYVECDDD